MSYRLLPKPQQQLLRRLSSNPRYPVDEKSRRAYRALSVPLKPYLTTSGAANLGDSTPIETRTLESPQKATIEVIGDGEALFSPAYDEQLGTEVITPATTHPDLPLDLLLPGFTRHEEKNVWVNPEPNDRLRDAWEAGERRRWGAGHVSDAEIVGHDEDDAGTER